MGKCYNDGCYSFNIEKDGNCQCWGDELEYCNLPHHEWKGKFKDKLINGNHYSIYAETVEGYWGKISWPGKRSTPALWDVEGVLQSFETTTWGHSCDLVPLDPPEDEGYQKFIKSLEGYMITRETSMDIYKQLIDAGFGFKGGV